MIYLLLLLFMAQETPIVQRVTLEVTVTCDVLTTSNPDLRWELRGDRQTFGYFQVRQEDGTWSTCESATMESTTRVVPISAPVPTPTPVPTALPTPTIAPTVEPTLPPTVTPEAG